MWLEQGYWHVKEHKPPVISHALSSNISKSGKQVRIHKAWPTRRMSNDSVRDLFSETNWTEFGHVPQACRPHLQLDVTAPRFMLNRATASINSRRAQHATPELIC